MKNAITVIFLLFLNLSCVSVTEEEYKLVEGKEIVETKSPTVAASLSFLPGVGNLYLTSDLASEVNKHQLGMTAILNWATWPVSILWGIPQAYSDAGNINIKETANLYKSPQTSLNN